MVLGLEGVVEIGNGLSPIVAIWEGFEASG
jgi:hypothetical protein